MVVVVFGVNLRRPLFFVYRQSQTVRVSYLWQWVTDRLATADVDVEEHFLELNGRRIAHDAWAHPSPGSVLRVSLVDYGFHRNRGPSTEAASSSLSSVSWLRAVTNSNHSDQIPGDIGEFYPQPGDHGQNDDVTGLADEDDVSLMQRLPRAPVVRMKVFVLHGGSRDCQMAESDWVINARSHILMSFGVQPVDWANTFVCPVLPTPDDLQREGLRPFILIYPGSVLPTQAHVLVEIEHMDSGERHLNHFRNVWRTSNHMSRDEFLEELGLRTLCRIGRANKCLVWRGEVLWALQDPHRHAIPSGLFLRLAIPGEDILMPIFAQAGLYNDGLTKREVYEVIYFEEWWTRGGAPQRQATERSSRSGRQCLSGTPRSGPSVALLRLAPPGNGVNFDPIVTFRDEHGDQCFIDHAVTNEHIRLSTATLEKEFWLDKTFGKWRFDLRFSAVEHVLSDTMSRHRSGMEVPLPFQPCSKNSAQPINFRGVMAFSKWFCRHIAVGHFNLNMRWIEASKEWISLPHWKGECPLAVHIYTDGSKINDMAGAAAVFWIQSREGWFFGGHLQHHLSEGWGSYDAELMACLMAGKWVFDTFRSLGFLWDRTPPVFLHFDSTSAGWGVCGCVQGSNEHPIFRAARSVFQLLDLLWPGVIQPCYIQGHCGDPGNESADVLSKHAAQNSFATDAVWAFYYEAKGPAFRCLPWIWLTFRQDLREYWKEGDLVLPAAPVEVSDDVLETLQTWQQQTEAGPNMELGFRCLTYNAMTLKAKELSGYVRLTQFLEECNIKGANVVAIQETRLTRKTMTNEHFWLLAHPCEKGPAQVVSPALGARQTRPSL